MNNPLFLLILALFSIMAVDMAMRRSQRLADQRNQQKEPMSIQLGHTYKDRITNFEGIATGYVQYLTGCNQALLAPKMSPDGTMRDSAWFDVQRLERQSDVDPIILDNGDTPGCDKAAPKR